MQAEGDRNDDARAGGPDAALSVWVAEQQEARLLEPHFSGEWTVGTVLAARFL